MQKWDFKEKYEIIETLLKEINQRRKNFQRCSDDDEFLEPIFYMYDVIEKNALFIRDECRNSLEPAVKKLYALLDKNGEKLTAKEIEEMLNTFLRIGYEQDCLDAMFMMNNELMETLFKTMFPEDEWDSETIKKYYIGPDVDFDKMPPLSAVLKAFDFDSTVKRLEWLVEHYHDDENAKLYLKARQNVRKKYKEKLKIKEMKR